MIVPEFKRFRGELAEMVLLILGCHHLELGQEGLLQANTVFPWIPGQSDIWVVWHSRKLLVYASIKANLRLVMVLRLLPHRVTDNQALT
jgi:hypothetical protein